MHTSHTNQELRHSLQLEQEQHQRELTALQTVHSQRLQSLGQRHQQEVDQLQQQLQEMREELAGEYDQYAPIIIGRNTAVCEDEIYTGLRTVRGDCQTNLEYLVLFCSAGRGGDRIQLTEEEDHQLVASVPEPSPDLKRSLEESQTRCATLKSEVLQLQKTVAEMEGRQPSSSELEALQQSKTSLEETNMELSERLAALEEEKEMLDGRVSELMVMLEEMKKEREKEEDVQEQRRKLLEATLHEQEQLNKGE